MSSSPVLRDDSQLSRLDQIWFRLESTMNLVAGITIFALVFLAVVHVLSRKLLNAPVPGYVDWTQQFMVIFAFLGLAYCQREGGHIRMDILVGRLRGRRLWLAEWFSTLLMLILTTALIFGTYYHFERSFAWDKPMWSRDSSIDVALPLWPGKLVVTLSLVVLWVRLALQLWGYGRAFWLNQDRPVAVPLVEDPAEQARHEAEVLEGADG